MLQALKRFSFLSRFSASSAPEEISPADSLIPASEPWDRTFALFNTLPVEIQLIIWEKATQNCFIKYVSVYYRQSPTPPHHIEAVKSRVEVIALDKRAWMRLMLSCKAANNIAEKADRTKRDDRWQLDSNSHALFPLLGRAQGNFKYWDFWERSESIKSRREIWREDFEMYVKCPHEKIKGVEEEGEEEEVEEQGKGELAEVKGKRVLKIMNPDVITNERIEKARVLGGMRKMIRGLLD